MLDASDRLNLLTLSFIDEQELHFATSAHIKNAALPQIRYRHALMPRKLNSLCMGLLECGDPTNNLADMFEDRNVDYLHRTVHEFLTSKETQQILSQITNSPVDIEQYLCNTFLAQVFYYRHLVSGQSTADPVRYVSDSILLKRVEYVFAHIWRLDLSAALLIELVDDLSALLTTYTPLLLRSCVGASYGNMPLPKFLKMLRKEPLNKSLILAMECKLSHYAIQQLSTDVVHKKPIDRHLLDHSLRPCLFRDQPCCAVIAKILEWGADPNEKIDSSTVWIQFLEFLRQLGKVTTTQRGNWLGAAKLMLQHGAAQSFTDLYGNPKTADGEIDWLFDKDTAHDLKQVVALSKQKLALPLMAPEQQSPPDPGRRRKRWLSIVLRQKQAV